MPAHMLVKVHARSENGLACGAYALACHSHSFVKLPVSGTVGA